MAGGVTRAVVARAQIARLAQAAQHGFSNSALDAVAGHDQTAIAFAQRFDPAPLESAHDERIAAYADELQTRHEAPAAPAHAPVLARVSLTQPSPAPTPAPPFRMRPALDESRDLECLTEAVYYEARGESAAGQAAVAQVVLNRTRHPAFPKSVCGVVYQRAAAGRGCQFSFACDGSAHRRVETYAWRRAEEVAARAMDGFVMSQVGAATHFHVASLSPGWGPRLLKVAQVGAHVFYRFSGRNGGANALSEEPQASEPLTAPPAQQPVYASLSLSPLTTVATTVANSVVGAATAGAELVMGAAKPKLAEAKGGDAAAKSAQDAPAPTATAAAPAAPATPAEPAKTAAAS